MTSLVLLLSSDMPPFSVEAGSKEPRSMAISNIMVKTNLHSWVINLISHCGLGDNQILSEKVLREKF